jgi:hypothetical protein
MRRFVRFLITHAIAVALGFALGIYALPILTAPSSPDAAMLEEKAQSALFTGTLTRDLRGSDFLHWGEGSISVSATEIVHEGKLAPGPDYMVYLTKDFVEHEDEFEPVKASVPEGVDVNDYTTVVVWCESFGEFITATKYR